MYQEIGPDHLSQGKKVDNRNRLTSDPDIEDLKTAMINMFKKPEDEKSFKMEYFIR